jgi:hypothetical protein
MIGLASLWPKALALLVAFAFGMGIYVAWRDVFRKKALVTAKLVFISVFVVLWVLAISQLFVREAIFHYELRQLRPEAVESIEIGGTVVGDPSRVSAIVQALNHAQWFASNHGGWGEEVLFTVHLRSGGRQIYHVAQYFRPPGAVLMSMSNYDSRGKGLGWSNGYVFCPDLPATLISSGVPIPGDKPALVKAAGGKAKPPSGWIRLLPLAIFGFFTLGALKVFYGITFGEMEVQPLHGGYGPGQPKWMGKVIGLPLVAMVAAGAGLRVVNTIFDWPDPTSIALNAGVWLVLLTFGIAVLTLKARRNRARPIEGTGH